MAPKRSKKAKATDVYEHDSDDAGEAREAARMEIDGVYEYEAPEKIRREDDSEIDEDGAFDSDDDATFGSFFATKAKAADASATEDEDDDVEDDDEEAGGDLLSDMLGTAPAPRLPTGDDSDDDADSDDDDDTKHASLMHMVDEMAKGPKRKVVHAEMTEDVAPSAFSKKIGGSELTLEALMASSMPSLPGDDDTDAVASASTAQLQKQFAALERDGSQLAASLEPVLEARASRKVAYAEKAKELEVFVPVVRANRLKETLDFRQQGPTAVAPSVAGLTAKFQPEKPMETDVAKLLAASGWSDAAAAAAEGEALELNAVAPEEVAARQKELAKMRALMFYEEQKARRVKKIKSKLYHKIRNKQDAKRERAALRELDPELAASMDAEEAEKRAEERMTLKHNNTSKWVKHQLGRGLQADAGTRQAIHDQLRRGDELRRKMESVAHESDLSSDDDSDGEPGESETQRLQRRLAKKASALVMEIDADAGAKADGLHGMKFMQKAVEKQRERALNEAEALLQELRGDAAESDDDANPAPAKKAKKLRATAADKTAVANKMVDGSQQMAAVMMDKGHKTRVASAIKVDFGDAAAAPALEVTANDDDEVPVVVEDAAPAVAAENPWLDPSAASKKRKKSRHKKKAAAESASVGSAVAALATAPTPAPTVLGPAATKRKAEEAAAPAPKKTKTDAPVAKKAEALAPKKAAELAQDELVRRAFAFADEGEDEIGAEKDRLAAEDGDAKSGAEVAKLTGMTGWGSWAGEGVKTSRRQLARLEQAKAVAAAAKQTALNKRKDAKMQRVLINEKKDKKAAKFMCATVPYPFTSREQYELAMRNPLGSDWNTTKAANELTAPAVMLRAGKIIQPLALTKQERAVTAAKAQASKIKATKAHRKAKF
ncbi:U3 small nucleolar RNA-associated protein [Achlya hypogyna]|uniref:U3 small nucleolar RNA-associated protein n=1 Tax=Achlya hypogyna TaxID=1202772 RepID=A0A1V9Z0T0_ACHHY|nr:U3 small nucleolar RNA-associated protein [Achlya hypogyna]